MPRLERTEARVRRAARGRRVANGTRQLRVGDGWRCTEPSTAVGGAGVKGRFRAAPQAESGD
jgi:hypothetical protein